MPESGETDIESGAGARAIEEFFELNAEFLRHYARGVGFNIKVAREVGGQEIKTAAIDLEKREAYFNPDFMAVSSASPEDAVFAALHEIEHLKELEDLLREAGGDYVWRKHRDTLKVSRAYGTLDNCYDDVKMNRAVTANAPVLEDTPKRVYKERLFQKSDMRDLPLHLQFAYSLVRNPMTGERAEVAPEVGEALESLEAFKLPDGREINLLEAFSRTDTKMAGRINFQEKYLRPILDKFLEEDMQNPKFQEPEPSGSTAGKTDEKAGEENGEGGQDKSEREPDPNEVFGEYYNEYDNFHGTPEEIDGDEMDKIAEKIVEQVRDENKSPSEKAFSAHAKKTDRGW